MLLTPRRFVLLAFAVVISPLLHAADPNYAQLRQLLVQERPSTVAEALAKLRARHPDFLANYTLAYRSLSLHGSSYQRPRAIVFGTTGKLVLTFNGGAGQRAGSNIEIMSFDETAGFSFREIQFKREQGAESVVKDSEVEFDSPQLRISKANPAVCLQCHGEKTPLPIWEPYFNWPGMYGSNDDSLWSDPEHSIGRDLKLKDGARDLEAEGFKAYLSQRAPHPRYRHLPYPYEGLRYDSIELDGPIPRPNLRLLQLLSEQRDRLLFRDLIAAKPTTAYLGRLGTALCVNSDWEDEGKRLLLPTAEELQPRRDALRDERAARYQEALDQLQQDFAQQLTALSYQNDDTGASDNDALIERILRERGLTLERYAFNLRRAPDYYTGDDGTNFLRLRQLVLQELARRKGPRLCRPLEYGATWVSSERGPHAN